MIVDPPRTGLSAEVLAARCGTSGVPRLVYVSCDPATLARDVRVLVEAGYTMRTRAPSTCSRAPATSRPW